MDKNSRSAGLWRADQRRIEREKLWAFNDVLDDALFAHLESKLDELRDAASAVSNKKWFTGDDIARLNDNLAKESDTLAHHPTIG